MQETGHKILKIFSNMFQGLEDLEIESTQIYFPSQLAKSNFSVGCH